MKELVNTWQDRLQLISVIVSRGLSATISSLNEIIDDILCCDRGAIAWYRHARG